MNDDVILDMLVKRCSTYCFYFAKISVSYI